MARKCRVTGKSHQSGHNVSHAKNRTKRCFKVNTQKKRIFIPWLGETRTLLLSTSAMRLIDKIGVKAALQRAGVKL